MYENIYIHFINIEKKQEEKEEERRRRKEKKKKRKKKRMELTISISDQHPMSPSQTCSSTPCDGGDTLQRETSLKCPLHFLGPPNQHWLPKWIGNHRGICIGRGVGGSYGHGSDGLRIASAFNQFDHYSRKFATKF